MLFNSVPESRHAITSLMKWEMHLPVTNLMINSWSLLSPTVEITLLFCKTLPENLRSHVIRCCSHVIRCRVWPLHSPDLTLVTFIFGYIWKMKYIKHILMFWKNWETASAMRFLQFLGKIFRVNNVLDQSIDCIRSGKEHFLHLLQLWWVFIGLSTGYWIFFSPSSPTVKPPETRHMS